MPTTTGIRAGAAASDGRLSIVGETAWGTTPSSPAFQNLRFTSESLTPSKETVRSDEIRPDRNVVDQILVGRSVAGSLDFELSYGTFDDLIEGLMFSEWATNVIKNGAGAGRSFTAERRIALGGASFDYQRFNGLVVNSMSLNIQANALVSGSFGVMGKFGNRATTILSGATYAAAPSTRVLNASTHFASLNIVGVTGGSPSIRSLSLEATNNLRAQNVVGLVDAAGIAPGRFEVSGSMEAYFANGNLLQAFLDHTDLSLDFTIGTAAGSRYKFTIPTLVLTGDPGGNISGNDDDVMVTMNFTGVLDRLSNPLLGCSLQIERGV